MFFILYIVSVNMIQKSHSVPHFIHLWKSENKGENSRKNIFILKHDSVKILFLNFN